MTKMTQQTFNNYALAQVDAPASSLLQSTLPLLEEPQEGVEEQATKIPSYVILPLLAIVSLLAKTDIALFVLKG